jgi:hypothetical protein
MISINKKEEIGYSKEEVKIIQKTHKQLRDYKFKDKKELPVDDYYSNELCYAIIYAYNLGRKYKEKCK